MNEWIDELGEVVTGGGDAVLVTIASTRGSAPREIGARMIVTQTQTRGTIGGGQLEHECTRIAVGMLGPDVTCSMRTFPLGAAMGQCCGGVVDVLFEPVNAATGAWLEHLRALNDRREPAALVSGAGRTRGRHIVTAEHVLEQQGGALPTDVVDRARALLGEGRQAERVGDYVVESLGPSRFNIAVFGAGHVGSEVVLALSRLDCTIRWIDSRRRIFSAVPRGVQAIEAPEPELEVAAMAPGSFYLVMTHSHALDFTICLNVLSRRDAAYCGLIGSRSKRRRFEARFRDAGMQQALIDSLVCPIGIGGIGGKTPAEIAIATAAEVLRLRESAAAQRDACPGNVRPIAR